MKTFCQIFALALLTAAAIRTTEHKMEMAAIDVGAAGVWALLALTMTERKQ